MQKGVPLQEIMNEVSTRLDHAPAKTLKPAARSGNMTELQAFIALDPLLADLNKQYLDAKANRIQSEKDFGRGDGMCDMAAILEDSAWCAMQARYMEVRGNRILMASAQKMMDEDRRFEEEQAEAEKKREALKTFLYLQSLMRMREKAEHDSGWWIMVLWAMGYTPFTFRNHHASYSFNRLAA